MKLFVEMKDVRIIEGADRVNENLSLFYIQVRDLGIEHEHTFPSRTRAKKFQEKMEKSINMFFEVEIDLKYWKRIPENELNAQAFKHIMDLNEAINSNFSNKMIA